MPHYWCGLCWACLILCSLPLAAMVLITVFLAFGGIWNGVLWVGGASVVFGGLLFLVAYSEARSHWKRKEKRERKSMSEGKWVAVKFDDIREGDTVRVTHVSKPVTTITEGKVKRFREDFDGPGKHMWNVADYENFYAYEFEPDAEDGGSTVEKFVPPFQWPTKFAAVVLGKEEGQTVRAVLVQEGSGGRTEMWWTQEWGTVTTADLSDLDDLTVVSEGVTVEA